MKKILLFILVLLSANQIFAKSKPFLSTRIVYPYFDTITNEYKDYIFVVGVASIVDGERTMVNRPSKGKYDLVKEGMKYEDVISLIGYPAYYTQDGKHFTAYYFNGLSVEFQTITKVCALLLSNYWTPNTLNIGLIARKKTKVIRIDSTHISNESPEEYYEKLYK